jgi:peptide/nickel transport system permease protein
MAIVALYVGVAIFAPWLAPYKEATIVSPQPFAPWSRQFLFGTDQLGRDILSRLLFGARNSVSIAVVATLLSCIVGAGLGMTSAVLQGWTDRLLVRVVDTLMAIPQMVFALVLLTMFGSSIVSLILILGLLDATRVFRLARAASMNIANADFVEAARLGGEGTRWIVAREILPNIVPNLAVEIGIRFCYVFLAIAALSFLGLGIQPPMADWGSMVRETGNLIAYGDVTPLLPAAAIATLTIATNFVVDWISRRTTGLPRQGWRAG